MTTIRIDEMFQDISDLLQIIKIHGNDADIQQAETLETSLHQSMDAVMNDCADARASQIHIIMSRSSISDFANVRSKTIELAKRVLNREQ